MAATLMVLKKKTRYNPEQTKVIFFLRFIPGFSLSYQPINIPYTNWLTVKTTTKLIIPPNKMMRKKETY